jgi:Uma2 family endonuclease
MILRGISWQTYERLLEEMGESHLRLTYNNGELEFMTLSYEHENFGEWIGSLILVMSLELQIQMSSGGSTTLKRSLQKMGLEPDKCYWIKHEKDMRGKKRWSALKDPPPDLAIEIDITSSWLDRLGIYAALKVPEVWRFNGKTLKVLVLGGDGKYKAKTKSLAFPLLPIEEFSSHVKKLGADAELTLLQEFKRWLRDVAQRKNGKDS